MMDNELKRNIMLDNYQNPTNRGLIDDDNYIKINTNNESCIDEINLMIKLNENKVEDIRFDGEACAICTSTTSIMIKSLIGKTISEALDIINNYENMIDEKEYNTEVLEEANCFNEIYKQPNRKKCALLPWRGIKDLLLKHK